MTPAQYRRRHLEPPTPATFDRVVIIRDSEVVGSPVNLRRPAADRPQVLRRKPRAPDRRAAAG
jgi:hypothetical protein